MEMSALAYEIRTDALSVRHAENLTYEVFVVVVRRKALPLHHHGVLDMYVPYAVM